jgi:SOS-response transcriptional repressor LexA
MIAKELTERQIKVLRYIEKAVATSGYPPTIREIGNAFGIKSTNGVNDHLRALMRKGYLAKQAGKSRTLTLLQPKTRARKAKAKSAIPIVTTLEEGSQASTEIFALHNKQDQTMTLFKKGTDNTPTVLSTFAFAF